MCLLEALSYDCPCLVSDIPENLEVGADYVQSFRSSDVEDLRKQMEHILSKPKEELNSSLYIKENYSWDHNIARTLVCYGEKECH